MNYQPPKAADIITSQKKICSKRIKYIKYMSAGTSDVLTNKTNILQKHMKVNL